MFTVQLGVGLSNLEESVYHLSNTELLSLITNTNTNILLGSYHFKVNMYTHIYEIT